MHVTRGMHNEVNYLSQFNILSECIGTGTLYSIAKNHHKAKSSIAILVIPWSPLDALDVHFLIVGQGIQLALIKTFGSISPCLSSQTLCLHMTVLTFE
jgi:hypothetical protein